MISLVVTAALAVALAPITVFGVAIPTVAVVAYGTAVGVFIDLDHFLIARLKTGGWDAVRFCVANPAAAVADQGQIFEPGDVGVFSRLLSHMLIAGVVVPAIALASDSLAIVTGVVLYAHVVADLIWDIQLLERHASAAGSLEEFVRTLR